MISEKTRLIALFADRCLNQWVVRDPEGKFWIVPPGDNGWYHRQPFYPTDETVLEPIPGRYIQTLDLPF
jgi:hypothetical protein